MASIRVDDIPLNVKTGENLLQVCLAHDIYIPHLCYLPGMDHPPAACRLCFVEIRGIDFPVAACKVDVEDGMVVTTKSARVRRLQKSALHLLLSAHKIECRNCQANRNCALQDIAKFLGIALKQKYSDRFLKTIDIDQSHPCLDYYPNRCVLCGRCIRVCRPVSDRGRLTFAWRGTDTVITYYGLTETDVRYCTGCNKCVEICPVGALMSKPAPDSATT